MRTPPCCSSLFHGPSLTNAPLIPPAEEELQTHLAPVTSAYELENLLKERYGVGAANKKARNLNLTASVSLATARHMAAAMNPQQQQQQQPRGPAPGAQPGNGAENPAAHLAGQSSQEMAGLLYISAGLKDDHPGGGAPAEEEEGVKKEHTKTEANIDSREGSPGADGAEEVASAVPQA